MSRGSRRQRGRAQGSGGRRAQRGGGQAQRNRGRAQPAGSRAQQGGSRAQPVGSLTGKPVKRWTLRRAVMTACVVVAYIALMWFVVFPWVDRTFVNRPAL